MDSAHIPASPEDSAEKRSAPAFPVVGIGASAGGLPAFQELIDHLGADAGMAYVLIPHLDAKHPSLLSEILTRRTPMPVQEVKVDNTPIEPNHIYVILPNTWLAVSDGKLKVLSAREQRSRRGSIDHFLMSLAESHRETAIAVVLSGTAADGSEGVRAVKSAGGITFAQDDSAQFPEMPRNAAATGCLDFVLPPAKIAEELNRIGKHPYLAARRPDEPPTAPSSDPDEERLREILRLLRGADGVDFSQYKQSTVRRRIARRMALGRAEALQVYLKYLEDHPEEVKALHDDILINVTNFFREPESFEALKEKVFPELLRDRPQGDSLRVWVPGCASGEEVYSLAIALLEFLDDRRLNLEIQMFGTDVSERAVEKARAGVYQEVIESDVSPERRRRFFTRTGGGPYQVSKAVRDLCVFARQDVTRDPPFSRLDILSCRNVLIYLGGTLQKRVFPIFHYALKPKGFLVLGSSETVGTFTNLFSPVDRAQKIYEKVSGSGPGRLEMFVPEILRQPPPSAEGASAQEPTYDPAKEADRILLSQFVPAAVVVDANGQVLHIRGDLGPYAKPAPGKPSHNLTKMVSEDLLVDFEVALGEAREKGIRSRRERVRLRTQGGLREIEIEIHPMRSHGASEREFLVLFRESLPQIPAESPKVEGTKPGEDAARLAQELAQTKEHHRAIVERLEVANEELRSAHEEVLSTNEELQSTNEKMETAKEELQSSNEELTTLNDELGHRNVELGQLTSDLQNVLGGIQVPIAIVDVNLRLRRFTPLAERLFNIMPTDVNRRITDFKHKLDLPDLENLLTNVIDTLVPIEREIRDTAGHWYTLRIRPYRTPDNRIEGVLLILSDVDELKRNIVRLEESLALLDGILDTVRDPLLVLDHDLRVRSGNASFYKVFAVSKEETQGRLVYELGNRQWNIPRLRELLEEILPKKMQIKDFEVDHDFQKIGHKKMLLHARQIAAPSLPAPLILLAIEDVTERRRIEDRIQRMNEHLDEQVKARTAELEATLRELNSFSYSVAHDLRAPLRTMSSYCHLLVEDYAGKVLDDSAQDYARRVMKAAEQMDTLIQNLLAYSRLTRMEMHLESIDLDPLVTEVLSQLGDELRERKAEVAVEGPLGRVKGHRVMLVQAVSNLVSNAAKFVAPGVRPRVRVRTEAHDGKVRLSVEDNGVGVAPEFMGRIFEVFERLNRQEAYPGTGVGLAIVRRAVERMGGRTGLESKLGQGSRFWIDLPPAKEGA